MAAVTLFVVLLSIASQAVGNTSPYIQVYPPDDNDTRTPLHFALVLSFGGEYVSIGALPGIQIALDTINNDSTILPGYSLHYTLAYSECEQSLAFRSFYEQINFTPIKVGWIGSGCSLATEPTAALTQYYNLVQLSCVSSSPELRNRHRYRYYFQLLATEVLIARGFYGIIRHFEWKRVGIITQEENVFTQTVDILRQRLEDVNIDIREQRFSSDDGVHSITQLFDSDVRIFVLAMFSPHARDVLCEAYRQGLRYPQYTFITYGWYEEDWWQKGNCSDEKAASLLVNTFAPVIREFPSEDSLEESGALSGYVSDYLRRLDADYNKAINLKSYIDDPDRPFLYSYHCYEATFAFAYALNRTITDLMENETLNRDAAKQGPSSDSEVFTMEDFTYNNSVVVSRMFEHMENTMFPGVTENEVRFSEDGIREVDTVAILQYQTNSDGMLHRLEVASVTGTNRTFNATSQLVLEYGIPFDGVPIDEVVTVSTGLTVSYTVLSIIGIIFTAVCLTFTVIFRKRKLIRLSSPNLNYLIGLGAFLLYLNAIVMVIPTIDDVPSAIKCNLNPWLTSLGYSLCYGTILIKMIRVWLIFNKPLGLKSSLMKDYMMVLFVLTLVVIDLTILGIYTIIVAAKGQIGVELVLNLEFPEDIVGPRAEMHRHLFYVCASEGRYVLYALLYGYKGLLTVIALVLAFRTRKVKIKGLNDSKYIAASIYITSIVLTVLMVSTYTLMDYVNVSPAVVGMGLLLGTTAILGLVFVPRMVELYKDPQGDKITFMSSVIGRVSENEIVELRKRISELESNLRQQTTDERRSSNLEHNGNAPHNNSSTLNGPTLNTV